MLRRIPSGGQTGVDRAVLDVGLALDLAVGDWCRKGRRAKDGRIPDRYPLTETPEPDYETRTRRKSPKHRWILPFDRRLRTHQTEVDLR